MTRPAVSEAVSYPAAELDRRFYAFAIDRLITWVLFAGAAVLAWWLCFDRDHVALGVLLIAGTVLLVSFCFSALVAFAGISPGKAVVGLRLVRADDGRPLGFGRACLRTLVLGAATLPTAGLGLATLAWTALEDRTGRRRGLHDVWTGGIVVDVRPIPVAEASVDRPRQIVNLTAMRLMPAPPPVVAETAAPAAAAPPVPAPVPPPPMPPPGRPVPPGSVPQAPPPPATAPLPTAPPVPRHAAPPTASGIGQPSGQPTMVRNGGPAPTSARWRVTFDTGQTFVVAGLALVGRRPEPRAGEPVAHLVALESQDMSVSKTHAQFQVVPDGALVVMDRGSTNGSVVLRRGVAKPLQPGRPATLVDGDTVRFGDRTMTVAKEQP